MFADRRTYAMLSERVFNRVVDLDRQLGWPVSVVRTAAARQMVMFRAILKRTMEFELGGVAESRSVKYPSTGIGG